MAYYVCSGAKLKCSMGSKQSELEVVHLTERVFLCGKPMANIKPFGQCSSMANPAVAAATSANYGRLQKMPCIPNIPFPWLNGKMKLIIKGNQALLSTSKCTCVWAATIEVADPGQSTVREDGPMNITVNEPTVETQKALGRGLLSSQDTAGIATQGSMASGFQSSQDGVASSSQSSQSTDVEPKVVEMYWSYGEGYKRLSDKARFYTDLNLHVKTENYKDGDSVSVTLKRKDGQPLFGTTKTLDLTGIVSNNEAVVENALKSYPIYVLSEITAECSGVKSSIHPRRPKWEDVYGGYPKITKDGSETDMYTDDVFKYILGSNYDKKVFNNGGAARISVSLIEAGMDLKKDFLVQDGSEFKKKLIQKSSDNEKKRIGFIASAKNLQEWLSSVWGKADVEIKGKTTIEDVQAAINGRNGVYIILGGFDSGASGATTLWLGSSNDALGGLNYVYKGGTVYFWELKGELAGKEGSVSPRLLIKKVKGVEEAYIRQRVRYEAIYNKNENEMSEEDKKKKIRWAIKVNGGEIKELGDKDITKLDEERKEIILEIKKEWVGNIVVMACIEGFNEKVIQKTVVVQDSEEDKSDDDISKKIREYTENIISKGNPNQEDNTGYIKAMFEAHKKGKERLDNKLVEALYDIQQKTRSDGVEWGFVGKNCQKKFDYIEGTKKSVDLNKAYRSNEDCEYGAHSHPSKSALAWSVSKNAGYVEYEGDLEHSRRSGKYLYVITKIGEIYFTTPVLAAIGLSAKKMEYGQVYLGIIEDIRGKKR